jgi:CDP-diacylglycerol--glycerol-3-phosphate 3-phosphatidyltransferase
MIVFKPVFLCQETKLVMLLLMLFLLHAAIAIVRYGKMSSFHTYAAKIAAILQGIFLLLLFFLQGYFYILFHITATVAAIELVEEIILV